MKRLLLLIGLLWASFAQAQQAPIVLTEGNRPSYCFGSSNTTQGTVTGPIFYLQGSASKTLRVVYAEVSGIATAATVVDTFWAKRTAAYTGGTVLTSGAPVRMDTATDPVSTAVMNQVTATTTAGAGLVARTFKLGLGTSASVSVPVQENFGVNSSRALVLRGTAEAFELNIATAPAGSSLSYSVCWVEE